MMCVGLWSNSLLLWVGSERVRVISSSSVYVTVVPPEWGITKSSIKISSLQETLSMWMIRSTRERLDSLTKIFTHDPWLIISNNPVIGDSPWVSDSLSPDRLTQWLLLALLGFCLHNRISRIHVKTRLTFYRIVLNKNKVWNHQKIYILIKNKW